MKQFNADLRNNFDYDEFKFGSNKKKSVRKFRKRGLFLIIVSIICLVLINYFPLVYTRYKVEGKIVEELIYKNNINQVASDSFFRSANGGQNIGVTLDDLSAVCFRVSISLIILIILGAIFTILEFVVRKKNISLEAEIVVDSFVNVLAIIVSVFIVFNFVKLLGSHVLVFLNSALISSFSDFYLVFPIPFIITIATAGLTKVLFTLLKSNFKEIEIKQNNKITLSYKSDLR